MSIFDAQAEIRKFTTIDFGQVKSVVLQVNQEVAQFLLSRNTEANRNVTPERVTSYRRQMEEGQWVLGDPIKFDGRGVLIDGQHRLKAVSENIVVSMVILVGLPSLAAETLDQGMKRNALHIAKFRGVKGVNARTVSTLRMMLLFRNKGDVKGLSQLLEARKLVSLVEKYPEVHNAIQFSTAYSSRLFAIKLAPVFAAVARAKLSEYPLSDQDLDYFLYCFQTGTQSNYQAEIPPQKNGDAPCLLRNYCNEQRKGRAGGGEFRTKLFYITQSALIAYKEQRTPTFFKQTTKNAFPVPLLDNLNTKTLELDIL